MDSQNSLPTLGKAHLLPKPERWMIVASVALILGLFLFHPVRDSTPGKTLAGWTWLANSAYNGNLHGRLIPLIFPWMLYVAFQRSKLFTLSPSYWGLISLSLGLFLFWAGLRANQPRYSLTGGPLIVLGFTHYLAGTKIAKQFIFPALVLCFTIPIPGLEMLINGNLQVLVTKLTYQIGLLLGFDLTLQGSTISIGEYPLELAGSFGIRIVRVTLFTAFTLAFFNQRTIWKQWFLFLISSPILIIFLCLRLVLILFLVNSDHTDTARKLYHDWINLFSCFFTVTVLLLLGYLLRRREYSPHKNLPA